MMNPFKKSMRVVPEKLYSNPPKKGKHYVMCDIHGMYGSYIEAIRKMSEEDELVIIGDVTDRGEHGIKILLDIIERQKNPGNGPKITFLLGNHELMLLSTIEIMFNNNWTANEVRQLIECDNFADLFNSMKSNGVSISVEEAYCMMNWVKKNYGMKTFMDYFSCIKPSEMKEIYNFLLESYVVLPKRIGNEHYLFVHAMPIGNKTKLEEMKRTGKGYNIMELTPEEYGFMLTERDSETYKLAQQAGFTIICGHTPRHGEINNSKKMVL